MLLTLRCPYRICIIAGDISPIDVIIHLPVMCEDRDIPYIYVPSKDVSQSEDCPPFRALSHVLRRLAIGRPCTLHGSQCCAPRADPAGVQSPAASRRS